MKSFFHTLKVELIHHQRDQTCEEVRRDIFAYIEIFYNRQRLHFSLGYLNSVDYNNTNPLNSLSTKSGEGQGHEVNFRYHSRTSLNMPLGYKKCPITNEVVNRMIRCIYIKLFLLLFLFLFVRFIPATDAQDEVDLSPVLQEIVQKYDLPSMVGAVILDGKLYATGIAGVRKAGTDIQAQIDDPYSLGSCTKSMTCTLIAMLIEEGKLDWYTPLKDIFPEYADTINPVYQPVTIQQLMMMHSGLSCDVIPDGMIWDDLYHLPGDTIQEQRYSYTHQILQSKEIHPPGETYEYSNAGYIVLGSIIEKITGTSWENFIQEKIFTPLGMDSARTRVYGSEDQVDIPWWHTLSEDGQRIAYAPIPANDYPPVYSSAGYVHCSVRDWAKFILIHLEGETKDQVLLKSQTIRCLHQPAFPDVPYACGWGLFVPDWGGGPYLFHVGSNKKNLSNVWLLPQNDFALLLVTNEADDAANTGIAEASKILLSNYAPTSHAAHWNELY